MPPHPTIAALLSDATQRLTGLSTTPRLDAELLLAHVLGWSRAHLLAEGQGQPTDAQVGAFAALIERRAAQVPVAYLTGQREFYGLALAVSPATLVPRPETELLVELALAEAQTLSASPLRIADLGTGSGAIAIALAHHLPNALVYATDLSAAALAVAQQNVARYGLSERVQLLEGDLLDPLPGPVDLLVSNPPYTILAEVEPNVRAHEPWLALDGGPDGAAIYRRLLAAAPAYLYPGGSILLEIGAWQGALVSDLVQQAFPTALLSLHHDLAGHDRVIVARLRHDSASVMVA